MKKCTVCNKVFSIPIPEGVSARKIDNIRKIKVCSVACRKERGKLAVRKSARKRYGTGHSRDEVGEIYFGNLKEPFMPVLLGHGYLGVIQYNKSKDKIQCHVCGLFFRAIGNHSRVVHGMDAEEYRVKFEIPQCMALIGEGTREKMIAGANNPEHLAERRKNFKKMLDNKKKDEPRVGHKRRIGSKNKTGTCPLQLLESIKKLSKDGKAMSYSEFAKTHHGQIEAIENTFGSYREAVRLANLEYTDKRAAGDFTKTQLIEILKNFYEKHGRTPVASDQRRGYVPTNKVFLRYFKSMNHARAHADIPAIVKLSGKYSSWRHVPMTKKLKKQLLEI